MKLGKYTKHAVGFCVAFSIMLSATFIKSDEVLGSPYTDVSSDAWYSDAVNTLFDAGIIPQGSTLFYPYVNAQRQDMILYLYNLEHSSDTEDTADNAKEENEEDITLPFTDVARDNNTYYKPICWAYENGIVTGFPDNTLDPFGECSREVLCTMAMRYLSYKGTSPVETGNADPFRDSMKVGTYARSYVVAAKLAGFINGDDKGNFRPHDAITRAELAQIICKMYKASRQPASEGSKTVATAAGAYDSYYDGYEAYIREHYHTAYVEENAPVDLSYFDDAVFVGDSVSMSLQFYCASTKALGNATFLCAGSLSPLNAHWEISNESKHPVYKGEKLTVEDAVARTGARKVYLLLGINSLSFGLDGCVNDMTALVDKILSKSPNAEIIIQSVTPMTADSPIKGSKLNNTVIAQYNQRMLDVAQRRGWYFVDVAKAVCDENGNLSKAYCSDPASMGIHFNYEADKVWINYLRTHAPKI